MPRWTAERVGLHYGLETGNGTHVHGMSIQPGRGPTMMSLREQLALRGNGACWWRGALQPRLTGINLIAQAVAGAPSTAVCLRKVVRHFRRCLWPLCCCSLGELAKTACKSCVAECLPPYSTLLETAPTLSHNINPLIDTLKQQSNGPSHSNTVIGTLVVDEWADNIWFSEEGTGWGRSPPRPLLAVPNVTAHPPTASVSTSYHSMWHYNFLWSLKG